MTREELKVHCEKQIKHCEMWANARGEKPSGSIYEEHKLILELLEQEPCKDAVSRQAVHNMLEDIPIVNTDKWFNWLQKACLRLADLPSVTPKTKWIPVSERMPKFNDIVLASADSDYGELRVVLTVYCAEEFWFNGKIKAWMPVPEPYKKEWKEGIRHDTLIDNNRPT